MNIPTIITKNKTYNESNEFSVDGDNFKKFLDNFEKKTKYDVRRTSVTEDKRLPNLPNINNLQNVSASNKISNEDQGKIEEYKPQAEERVSNLKKFLMTVTSNRPKSVKYTKKNGIIKILIYYLDKRNKSNNDMILVKNDLESSK